MTFEENTTRLEEILKKLEDGKITLDEANKLFSEALALSKQNYELLEKSKGQITVLNSELEKLTEKPL